MPHLQDTDARRVPAALVAPVLLKRLAHLRQQHRSIAEAGSWQRTTGQSGMSASTEQASHLARCRGHTLQLPPDPAQPTSSNSSPA
jgi:hypothetical protein